MKAIFNYRYNRCIALINAFYFYPCLAYHKNLTSHTILTEK